VETACLYLVQGGYTGTLMCPFHVRMRDIVKKKTVCCTLNAQRFATFVPWVAELFLCVRGKLRCWLTHLRSKAEAVSGA